MTLATAPGTTFPAPLLRPCELPFWPWWAWLSRRRTRDQFKRGHDSVTAREEYRLTRIPATGGPPAPTGYFVDSSTGSNANTGTSLAQAWATLAFAAANAPVGSDIYVRGGGGRTYSGMSFAGRRFHGYPGDPKPKISQATQYVVTITGSGSLLDGFEVTGANVQWGSCVRVTNTTNVADAVVISNNYIHDGRSFGVYLQSARGVTCRANEYTNLDSAVQVTDAGSNVTFDNEWIHDLTTMVVLIQGNYGPGDPLRPGSGDRGANAFVLTRVAGPVTIKNCLATGLRAFSSQYQTDGGFVEFYECSNIDVIGNTVIDSENFCETGNGTGQPSCSNLRMLRNVFWSGAEQNVLTYPANWTNPSTGAVYTAGARVPRSANGMILRSASSSLVAHNTIVDTIEEGNQAASFAMDLEAGGAFAGDISNLKVKNNLLRGTSHLIYLGGTMPTGVEIDYNLYYNPSGGAIFRHSNGSNYTTLANVQTNTPYEDHGVVGDPKFTNYAGGDFTLQATSPAINAGLAGVIAGETFLGSAPDIGYKEKA